MAYFIRRSKRQSPVATVNGPLSFCPPRITAAVSHESPIESLRGEVAQNVLQDTAAESPVRYGATIIPNPACAFYDRRTGPAELMETFVVYIPAISGQQENSSLSMIGHYIYV